MNVSNEKKAVERKCIKCESLEMVNTHTKEKQNKTETKQLKSNQDFVATELCV